GDVVDGGEGYDTVLSSVDFTMATGVEQLVLTGSLDRTGVGNGDANLIVGNSGNNMLVGNGGNDTLDGSLGTDTMIGGDGDDTYIVNYARDVVQEDSLSGGIDTVMSFVSRALGAGSNLENLVLFGTAAVTGSGNELDNIITGYWNNNEIGRA